MNIPLLDLYSDYLISSFSAVTATGLSSAVNGAFTHDQITRFLSGADYGSKELWSLVKPTIRRIESEDGVLIFDDTIEEKPYSDENELVATHYHHTTGTYVKGINTLSCLYHCQGMNIPVTIQPIAKTVGYTGKKKSDGKRTSPITKNEYYRQMLDVCVYHNHLKFGFVVSDVWYSSVDNMEHIKLKLRKDFVMPIKSNRLVAFSAEEKLQGQWQQIEAARTEAGKQYHVWLKGLSIPVLLIKQVFANKDGSTGVLYLVCSDLIQTSSSIIDIYRIRWNIEPQYKSVKENLGLAQSPTHTARTQANHICACFYAYFKLEQLKMTSHLNHFSLKTRLYLKAVQASMEELRAVKVQYGCV